MVQFGELCAWEMPESAGTRMRDGVEIRPGELWVSASSGGLVCVCVGV